MLFWSSLAPFTCAGNVAAIPASPQYHVHITAVYLGTTFFLMDIPATPIAIKVLDPEATSARKKMVDANDSYIEEEDATYVVSESSDDEDLSEADFEEDDVSDHVVVQTDKHLSIDDDAKPPGDLRTLLVANEIPRKIFHSFHGFVTLYLYCNGYSATLLIVPLWTLFAIFFASDVIRFNSPRINQIVIRGSTLIMRPSEMNLWNGIVFYLAGLAIVFTFAPKDIAVMSVLLLSWADTAASTFGRQFGRYTMKVANGKSLAGSLASGFTGMVACYLFYGYFVPYFPVNLPGEIMWTPESSRMSLHVYAFVCGVASSVSEAIQIAGVDDNFTIPVLGSAFIYAAVKAFQK